MPSSHRNTPASSEVDALGRGAVRIGNVTKLSHSSGGVGCSRYYGQGLTPAAWLTEVSARLNSGTWSGAPGNQMTNFGAGAGGDTQGTTHQYDAAGNLIQSYTNHSYEWGANGNMRFYKEDSGTVGTRANHLYDHTGARAVKLTSIGGAGWKLTHYQGTWERYTVFDGSTTVFNDRYAVGFGYRRVGPDLSGATAPDEFPEYQWYLQDRVGSITVVLDDTGDWVNREECSPYGETLMGSYARKLYRYNGKERDEETAFYYYGFRYYAPWLMRWTRTDPAGAVDGLNLYAYVGGRPVGSRDANGLQEETTPSLPDVSPGNESPSGAAAIQASRDLILLLDDDPWRESFARLHYDLDGDDTIVNLSSDLTGLSSLSGHYDRVFGFSHGSPDGIDLGNQNFSPAQFSERFTDAVPDGVSFSHVEMLGCRTGTDPRALETYRQAFGADSAAGYTWRTNMYQWEIPVSNEDGDSLSPNEVDALSEPEYAEWESLLHQERDQIADNPYLDERNLFVSDSLADWAEADGQLFQFYLIQRPLQCGDSGRFCRSDVGWRDIETEPVTPDSPTLESRGVRRIIHGN